MALRAVLSVDAWLDGLPARRDGVTYQELGADYYTRRHRESAVRRHMEQLEALGFHVTIGTAA